MICLFIPALILFYVQMYLHTSIRSPLKIYQDTQGSNGFRRGAKFLGLHNGPGKLPESAAEAAGFGKADRSACDGATLRLGNVVRGDDDGGWNVCAGAAWPPDEGCVVYSFGSNYEFSFDLAAASLGCEVHVFDPSMPGYAASEEAMLMRERHGIVFHDIGLGAAPVEPSCTVQSCGKGAGRFECLCSWRLDSVASAMQRLGHDKLEILKIDIEGAEWAVLEALVSGDAPFLGTVSVRQLLVELHLSSSGVEPQRGKDILQRLGRDMGLRLWSRDENRIAGRIVEWGEDLLVIDLHEMSYVRGSSEEVKEGGG